MTVMEFVDKWVNRGVIYDEYPPQFIKDLKSLLKKLKVRKSNDNL